MPFFFSYLTPIRPMLPRSWWIFTLLKNFSMPQHPHSKDFCIAQELPKYLYVVNCNIELFSLTKTFSQQQVDL